MAQAKWTTNAREIVATSATDGSFHGEIPLYDAGVKQMTLVLDISSERVVELFVRGEPGARLSGFRALSNIDPRTS